VSLRHMPVPPARAPHPRAVATAARPAVMLAAVLVAGGCYTQVPFPVEEVKNLDGYTVYKEHEETPVPTFYVGGTFPGPVYGPTAATGVPRVVTDKPYRVVSLDGDPMDFSSETPLTLHLKDGRALEATYRTISVTDERFEGVTMEGGHRVSVPLSALSAVTLRRPDSGSTLLVTLAIVGGVVVLLSVAVIASGG
jgi:hypothetical protein